MSQPCFACRQRQNGAARGCSADVANPLLAGGASTAHPDWDGTAMALQYDHRARALIGVRYRVAERTFVRRLRQCLQQGWEPEVTLAYLLNEDHWQPAQGSVQPLALVRRCQACGHYLPRGQRSYCDAVCAAVHQQADHGAP